MAPGFVFTRLYDADRTSKSRIELVRDDTHKIEKLALYTRDGWIFSGLNLLTFRKLKRKRAIASSGGKPYLITTRGLELVRGELDNR